MPVPTPFNAKNPATNVVASYAGGPDAFATAILNTPNVLGGELKKIYGLNLPSSIKELVILLPDNEKKNLMNAIHWPPGQIPGPNMTVCTTDNDLVDALETSDALKAYLKNLAPKARNSWSAPGIKVNPFNGLNLLLSNPNVARVVMDQRKKQTALAAARVIPSGGLFGLPLPFMHQPSVSVLFKGGASGYDAFDPSVLDPVMPIEMRGAGYAVAHMRGGHFPLMLGTVGSPTQWRPISDDSFISLSLRQALDSLNNTLKTKHASLDPATKTNVDTLITQLEAAEKAVKDERDNLNSFNNAIATGSANVQGKKNIDSATLSRTVDAYNNAMKNRQKLENKLFRVVIALGGKVQVI
jgi:hypothetical protein